MGHVRDVLVILLLNLAAMGAVVWHTRDGRAGAVRILPPPTLTPAPTTTAMVLHVYVSGAVTSPGVVELPEGARADDAVRAAAGFRPEADTAAVNLAAPVADGAQLHVPAVGELPASVGAPGTSAFGRLAAGQPAAAAVTGPSTAGASGVVNVNQATAAELESLPGIGPALAQRIVDYRMANGPFARIEDLTAVSGIGERTLEKLRDRIVVR